MYELKDIKVVHLEVTQNCQAACPMCDRNCNGEGINPHINLDELSLKDCKDIFNTSFIKQLDTMYMCGNLGDPIIARDTLKIFKYFRKHNPNMWLSMNTNAGARNNIWWQELADIFGSNGNVIFSVRPDFSVAVPPKAGLRLKIRSPERSRGRKVLDRDAKLACVPE